MADTQAQNEPQGGACPPSPPATCATGEQVVKANEGEVCASGLKTGRMVRTILVKPKCKLDMILKDDVGQALPGKAYRVFSAAGEISGTTDGSGLLSEKIPMDWRLLTVEFEFGEGTRKRLFRWSFQRSGGSTTRTAAAENA